MMSCQGPKTSAPSSQSCPVRDCYVQRLSKINLEEKVLVQPSSNARFPSEKWRRSGVSNT